MNRERIMDITRVVLSAELNDLAGPSICARISNKIADRLIEEMGEEKPSENEIEVDGKRYVAVDYPVNQASCTQCAFYAIANCSGLYPCYSDERKDKRSVLWKLKEDKPTCPHTRGTYLPESNALPPPPPIEDDHFSKRDLPPVSSGTPMPKCKPPKQEPKKWVDVEFEPTSGFAERLDKLKNRVNEIGRRVK